MRVVIFDIRFGTYIYHSTPTPTMETIMLSGYEKEQGNLPSFTNEPPDFKRYNRVYLVKDCETLFHDPDWLKYDNVILVGKGWGSGAEWRKEWEEAVPDMDIYKNWINNWIKRYPKFSESRLEKFFLKPHKIKQGKRISMPQKENLLIVDNDIKEWDKNYNTLKEIDVKHMLLSPLEVDGMWDDALEYFGKRALFRKNFWAKMNLHNYNKDDIQEALEIYKKHSPGRMFRIKAFDHAYSEQEWIERIKFAYWIMGEFRMQAEKRLFYEPSNYEGMMLERIIKEMKRWSAKDNGYRKNSLFDYMLYDGCRNIEQMARALHDPYQYILEGRHGKNKLVEIMPVIDAFPEIMDIITKSYPKGAY